LLSAVRYLRPEPQGPRPSLGLMTTLPLQWSEGGIEADLASDAAPHPVYTRLQQQYDVRPIDNFDALDTTPGSLLLLAQPRALAPAELVKLDGWVRKGGRLLVLADPALQWGSLYPLGDKRRPLFTSLLSPLFSHWGLELVLPMTDEQALVLREVDGVTIRTQTPGEWLVKSGRVEASCRIAPHKLLADCRVGKGRALLVADADLLDTVYWEGQGVRAVTGNDEFANVHWVDALMSALRDGGKNPRDFMGK
jgi:ABC-type uncharacterized transport system involved in gliding motility auxiliary subunit